MAMAMAVAMAVAIAMAMAEAVAIQCLLTSKSVDEIQGIIHACGEGNNNNNNNSPRHHRIIIVIRLIIAHQRWHGLIHRRARVQQMMSPTHKAACPPARVARCGSSPAEGDRAVRKEKRRHFSAIYLVITDLGDQQEKRAGQYISALSFPAESEDVPLF